MRRFLRYSALDYKRLSGNSMHVFAQRYALNLYETDSIYSLIPKNACTTMRTTIAHVNGCIQDLLDFNWIHDNNTTFAACLRDLIRARYTFTILRCPFARLVSVYLDKIVGKNEVTRSYEKLHNRRISTDDVTFGSFVKSIQDEKVRLGNIHWRPQEHFLVYEEYDDYFSLENFSTAERVLKERIGIDLIDARPLTGHGSDGFSLFGGQGLSAVPASELLSYKRDGRLPNPKAMYDDELVDIVSHCYEGDLSIYGQIFGTADLMFS